MEEWDNKDEETVSVCKNDDQIPDMIKKYLKLDENKEKKRFIYENYKKGDVMVIKKFYKTEITQEEKKRFNTGLNNYYENNIKNKK